MHHPRDHLLKAAANNTSAATTVNPPPRTNSGASRKYGFPMSENSAMGNEVADMLTVRTIICAQDAPRTECGAAYIAK
jgi:hypothetical protein